MNSAQRRVSKRTRKPVQREFPAPAPRASSSTSSQKPALDEPREETPSQDIVPVGLVVTYDQMVAQEQPTNFRPAPVPFHWTTERTLEMLYSMWNKRPVGVDKYKNILQARHQLNLRLKLNVPIKEVWDFINNRWDLEMADAIESNINYRHFPCSPKWRNVDEQVVTEAGTETVEALVSETVEVATAGPSGTSCRRNKRKIARVMVERIDHKLNKKQMDQLLKCKAETALPKKLNDVQIKSTSSKVKTASKRKRSNTNAKK